MPHLAFNIGYDPEAYWNNVAKEIEKREKNNLIAGDDEPYYKYKREKFLKTFRRLPFSNKKIIEIGSGPGGNLLEVYKMRIPGTMGGRCFGRVAQVIAGINFSFKY